MRRIALGEHHHTQLRPHQRTQAGQQLTFAVIGIVRNSSATIKTLVNRSRCVIERPGITRYQCPNTIVSITELGDEPVYDATVAGTHNFIADGIIVHNSIEQDADVVMFIYRDEYYDKESEREGIADLIIAKHRNGPIGTMPLAFQDQFPKFANLASSAAYAGAPEAEPGEAA